MCDPLGKNLLLPSWSVLEALRMWDGLVYTGSYLHTWALTRSLSPYAGKGSTNKVVEWYNLLVPKTRAYIREAGFELILSLLPERSTSATLVQCLIERWWDTTHTFHIAEQKMTVTLYDFYRMTDLSFEGAINSLDGVLGIQLGFDMLGRKYSTETSLKAGQPLLACSDLEAIAIIALKITRPFKGVGLRAFYLAERVRCQLEEPAAGELIDPSHLPWTVYAYGPDGFAWERVVPCNPNVIGYPFPSNTRVPTIQEHEELVWLARNLKLEVTKYSRNLYGPERVAYLGGDDDDDDEEDSEATTSCQPMKRRHH
ncbi:hypothetical protein SO802_002421 [Lithocarpus litseifolius]|uniref:Aminotransferase-like plant mobile domain-containing protein n=1 Tax=Lithocarpus litseifolius TaxID=425828 RepID=A0AAW2DX59_9ROSI